MIKIPGYNPIIDNAIYYKEKNPKTDFTPVSSVILLSKFRAPSVDELTDYIKAKFIKIVDQSQEPDENVSLEGLLAILPQELYDEIGEENFNFNRIKEMYTKNNAISASDNYLRMEHGWIPTVYLIGAINQKFSFSEYEAFLYNEQLKSYGLGVNIRLRIKLDNYKPASLSAVLRTIKETYFQSFVGDDVSVDFNPELTSEDQLFNFINTVYKGITLPASRLPRLFQLPQKRILTNPVDKIYESTELELDKIATHLIVKILDENYAQRNRDEKLPQLVPLNQIDGFLSDEDDEDQDNFDGGDPTIH